MLRYAVFDKNPGREFEDDIYSDQEYDHCARGKLSEGDMENFLGEKLTGGLGLGVDWLPRLQSRRTMTLGFASARSRAFTIRKQVALSTIPIVTNVIRAHYLAA